MVFGISLILLLLNGNRMCHLYYYTIVQDLQIRTANVPIGSNADI